MDFNDNKPIYLQIADHFSRNILKGVWSEDEKVPSVRQLAVELEVNPNTVMRTYTILQDQEIIYNKRGIGFFVSPNAKPILMDQMKEQFIKNELPEFFKTLHLLGLEMRDLEPHFTNWKKENIKG